MKRLQIYIEEDLDVALQREARRLGTSKAALIRQYTRERVGPYTPPPPDPLELMDGSEDFPPAPIDDVVYS